MLTSAVLGTDSQKTSILMSPAVVWSVTDMADDKQSRCSAHHAASRGLMSSGKKIQTHGQPYRILRGLEAAFAVSNCRVEFAMGLASTAWRSTTQSTGRSRLPRDLQQSSIPSDLSHPANPKACSSASCTVYTITLPTPSSPQSPHSLAYSPVYSWINIPAATLSFESQEDRLSVISIRKQDGHNILMIPIAERLRSMLWAG